MDIRVAVFVYVVLDTICAGMGMGVPFFCILLGFPVGWYVSKHATLKEEFSRETLRRVLKYAFWTSAFTFLLMAVIWGRTIPMLFNPNSDFKNFGHPFILYDPKLSFVGWLVLMILISPFLQLLATVFASVVTLAAPKTDNSRD